MMITRQERQTAADQITISYQDLETQIMQNIIRHIRDYKKLIDSDEWLMQKLAELGKLTKENIKIIANAAVQNREAVEHMCYDVADLVISRIEPDLKDYERMLIVEENEYIPSPNKSKNLKRAVKTVNKQAWDHLNKCNTEMLYMAQDAYRQLVQGIVNRADEIKNKQSFLDIIGRHATAEAVGSESRGQAIRNVIKEFNSKGIPAFVDKRGRQWTPEAYVSMTLRTTAGNVATEAMNARMDDLGLSLIQVSSHSGARPKCAKDQGKIFDKNGGSGTVEDINGKKIRYYPLSSSSYGEPDGLFGINCGHHGKPFIPGVSRSRWEVTKDLEENDKEYRKMQMQRGLERDVRNQKRLCSMYKELGDDTAFEQASVILKSREYKLKDYIKKSGLARRKDREQVYGFDKVVSGKSIGVSQKHYKNWARSIGAEAGPKRLAGYYELKYNKSKESRLYRGYVKAVNGGKISPLVKYDKFKEIANDIERQFVGTRTVDGLEIKGYTAHFVDRVIGQRSADSPPAKGVRNGATYEQIKDALSTPKKIGEVVIRSNGMRSKLYYGANVAVSYNLDTMELVQVQPKRTK